MENIRIENPWYGMINSPEQVKRRTARMKQDKSANGYGRWSG